MKADHAYLWTFTEEVADSSEIKCPHCGVFSPLTDWRVSAVGCEDCGEHEAMVCPECDHCEDHVYSDQWNPMEARAAASPSQAKQAGEGAQ